MPHPDPSAIPPATSPETLSKPSPASTDVTAELTAAIDACGYYPELVADSLRLALAGEPVHGYLVQHEPTFDLDEIRRHLTVLALTPTRLVVGHTDEHPADEVVPTPFATTSTESVPLGRISAVGVSRMVPNPAGYRGGTPGVEATGELTISINWGTVRRLDLEPAICPDPECEADHGFTGSTSADDINLRISAAADGRDAVGRALNFARALSAATVPR